MYTGRNASWTPGSFSGDARLAGLPVPGDGLGRGEQAQEFPEETHVPFSARQFDGAFAQFIGAERVEVPFLCHAPDDTRPRAAVPVVTWVTLQGIGLFS